MKVADIRRIFIEKKKKNDVVEINGVPMLEMIAATFEVDEPAIFGTPNEDYIRREIEWYLSTSLNVNDIKPPIPKIWKDVASSNGEINSNYGYLVFSRENHSQYFNVLNELRNNPSSRRAQMIYTRPSIWKEYDRDGMSDFICTDSVQYFIRDGKLVTHVRMRSNDVVFGAKNDFAWQNYVRTLLSGDLNIPLGKMYWTVGSLHVYERHFHLVKE